MPEVLSYNEDHAQRALKNAVTRARKHLMAGKPAVAAKSLESGLRTYNSWGDGTHPQAK